jgi:hypothetical protein
MKKVKLNLGWFKKEFKSVSDFADVPSDIFGSTEHEAKLKMLFLTLNK